MYTYLPKIPRQSQKFRQFQDFVYTLSVMRASDKAYQSLHEDIVNWRLAPGSMLAEIEQSERLGVSRTPVREAISRLVADGLAIQQRGRGAVVSDISHDHLEHLFALRRALECEAARAAASSSQHAGFAALAAQFEQAAAGELAGAGAERCYALSASLDESIELAAANPYLSTALRTLRGHLQRVRRLARDDPARLAASALEHAAIARGIASGQPDIAAAATLVHLHQSLTHFTTHMPSSSKEAAS